MNSKSKMHHYVILSNVRKSDKAEIKCFIVEKGTGHQIF